MESLDWNDPTPAPHTQFSHAYPYTAAVVGDGGDWETGVGAPDVHTHLRYQRAVSDFGRLRLLDRTLRDEKLSEGEAKVRG